MPNEGTTLENRWDASIAKKLTGLDLLVYASNLLGSDPRITNFGGGNTSLKHREADPMTGDDREVLWVKGSGGDLGTATRSSFASLDLAKVLSLEQVQQDRKLPEDAIVPLYSHCNFNLNPVPCSIDTPLHAFVPKPAVSHMHADSVIAIAASADAEKLTKAVWDGKMGFVPWRRPGFELGLMIRAEFHRDPSIQGVLMGGHGFICWHDDWQACYALTLDLINQAQTFLDTRGRSEPFGKAVRTPRAEPRLDWLKLLPEVRGLTSFQGQMLIAKTDASEEVIDFLAADKAPALASLGTSCPDHFLRTKIAPLWLDPDAALAPQLDAYRKAYEGYYSRCAEPDSPPMRNPNPSVILVPGLGMISLGKSPAEARVTGEFYRNAIRVMQGAEAVSRYVALPEQEAFNIEYWALEEAKLRRQPPEKEFSRRVALVTGAAQGIGLATTKLLVDRGACVAMLDIDGPKLQAAANEITSAHGEKRVLALTGDVTNPEALRRCFEEVILTYGGLDIAVVNAGSARRGTVAETSDETYDQLSDLLMKAYFNTAKIAVQAMSLQGQGGSIVVVGSKNGVAAGANSAIYSASKAFELHLMRTIALDHAAQGIRCNAVNPDGVVVGSGIWNDKWRTETAGLLGIEPDQVADYYRNRSLLKLSVTPEDVARAIIWLASDAQSSRTTGCVITVDGGNKEGFLR